MPSRTVSWNMAKRKKQCLQLLAPWAPRRPPSSDRIMCSPRGDFTGTFRCAH